MPSRIVLRTGEALVEGALDYLCAEPEIVIGELDGPVGQALATLLGAGLPPLQLQLSKGPSLL